MSQNKRKKLNILILVTDQAVKILNINNFSFSPIQKQISPKMSLGLSLNCP